MKHFLKIYYYHFSFNVLTVNALQLGKISVNSKQEQPLNADIEVILTKADDVTELVPSIASKEDLSLKELRDCLYMQILMQILLKILKEKFI